MYLLNCDAPVITLTLLHPIQSTPIKSWRFEHESVIRIGRSTENNVVLYSAVVSRLHVELRRNGRHWELINLGTNGTYLDGSPITQVPVVDGLIVRLARSGPQLQIHLGMHVPKTKSEQQIVPQLITGDSMEHEAIKDNDLTESATKPLPPPAQVVPSTEANCQKI